MGQTDGRIAVSLKPPPLGRGRNNGVDVALLDVRAGATTLHCSNGEQQGIR